MLRALTIQLGPIKVSLSLQSQDSILHGPVNSVLEATHSLLSVRIPFDPVISR